MSWYDYLNPFTDLRKLTATEVTPGDTTADTNAIANSQGIQGDLQNRLATQTGAYDPTQAATNTTNQNQLVTALQAQANGTAPSAAELQLKQQAAQNQASAYGNATALQGRNPGQALRAALGASTATQAATNSQAAQMRASEQASGQNQLSQALSGMQGQQATSRGQDINQTLGTEQNILGASGQQVTAAGNVTGANLQNAAAQNTAAGGIVSGALNAVGNYAGSKSDPTEKKNIAVAPLDKLANALQGFTFDYKHPGTPGEAPGRRVGIMATDALKGGPVGRSMVRNDTNDGKLALDGGNSLGAALAMSAEALRRTRKAA